MADLLRDIVSYCQGRSFSSPDEIYAAFPSTSSPVIDNMLLKARRRGLLRMNVREVKAFEGSITIINNIRPIGG